MVTSKTIIIRVRWADWVGIKKVFPSYRGETAQAYFYRLSQELIFGDKK
jgi:hypothetical protein